MSKACWRENRTCSGLSAKGKHPAERATLIATRCKVLSEKFKRRIEQPAAGQKLPRQTVDLHRRSEKTRMSCRASKKEGVIIMNFAPDHLCAPLPVSPGQI